jgi:hypothetical protein
MAEEQRIQLRFIGRHGKTDEGLREEFGDTLDLAELLDLGYIRHESTAFAATEGCWETSERVYWYSLTSKGTEAAGIRAAAVAERSHFGPREPSVPRQ